MNCQSKTKLEHSKLTDLFYKHITWQMIVMMFSLLHRIDSKMVGICVHLATATKYTKINCEYKGSRSISYDYDTHNVHGTGSVCEKERENDVFL